MRRLAGILLPLALALASCASGGAALLEPEIVIAQMPDNFNLLAFRGPVAIRLQVTIGNPSSESVTIERLEIRTNGPGPYSIPTMIRGIGIEIAGGEIVTFDYPADAVSRGDDRLTREPVTISGTAYFRTIEGPFSKSFIQIIRSISEDRRSRQD